MKRAGLVAIALLAILFSTVFATSTRSADPPTAATPTSATPAAATPAAATPASCKVGVDVLTLHGINLDDNTFDAGFWIWSVCPNDQFKPLTTMEFVNADSATVSMQGGEVKDGMYWDYARVDGTFRYPWNLKDFPFDSHTLQIRIEDSSSNASIFVYEPDTAGSALEPDLPLEGFNIAGFNIGSSVHSYQTTYGDPQNPAGTSDYSRLTVGIELQRRDFSGFLKLTFVVYMAFLLSLVSYFINLKNPTMLTARIGMISGALFAVAVNFRTATTALSSAEGLTMAGLIHAVTLVAIVVDAAAALVAQTRIEHGYSEEAARQFDRRVMLTVVTIYVVFNICLIGFVWLRNT